MILDELDDLFDDLDIQEPTAKQSYQMYGIFLNDFVRNPFCVNGKRLKINENKSNHYLFRGKIETFVHVVTRKSKYSGKRNFDKDRANKIHWIRPILENSSDKRIFYFEKINDEGKNQFYYWFKEKNFIVILRQVEPSVLLVTAFCVDVSEIGNFGKWYAEYKSSRSLK
jgi:hypothetical protein